MGRVPILLGVLVAAIAGCGSDVATPSVEATLEPPSPIMALSYRCGVVEFRPGVLITPDRAELDADPAAAALREFLASPLNADGTMPLDGWRRLGTSGNVTEFANDGDGAVFVGYVSVPVERRAGRWSTLGGSSCTPRRAARGNQVSLVWWLPNGQPEPSAQRLTVEVVIEDCKVGPESNAILDPIIATTDDEVTIVLTARRPGRVACPDPRPNVAGAPTLVEIDLGEVIGDRLLFDGSVFPARDALSPPDWYFGAGG